MTKLKKDIERLKEILRKFEEHYSDDEWDLRDFHEEELYRITGLEAEMWDEGNVRSYIDGYINGMERIIHLQEVCEQ